MNNQNEIMVFKAQGCPHCPLAIEAAQNLHNDRPHIQLKIIDIANEPELVNKYKIKSVPTTILGGTFYINEVVPISKLASILDGTGTLEVERQRLLSQINNGHLDIASECLLEIPFFPKAFAEIWRSSTLNLRMGLMLAAGAALEHNIHLFDNELPVFEQTLTSAGSALKGDTADLLGQTRSPAAKILLQKLLEDADNDVVEAARDALENY